MKIKTAKKTQRTSIDHEDAANEIMAQMLPVIVEGINNGLKSGEDVGLAIKGLPIGLEPIFTMIFCALQEYGENDGTLFRTVIMVHDAHYPPDSLFDLEIELNLCHTDEKRKASLEAAALRRAA